MVTFRFSVLWVAFGIAAVSSAQSFELRAGAGTSLVGSTFLTNPNTSFNLEVWANLPTAIPSSTAIRLAIAFGDAVGSGVNATPTNTFLQYQNWQWAPFVTANYTNLFSASVRSAPNPVSGNNYATTNSSLLPIVAYNAAAAQTVSPVTVPAGQTRLATLTFSNFGGLLFQQQNIYVAHYGGTASLAGSSGINPSFGSTLYQVRIVPEPGTLLSISLGVLAIIRSRRKA